MSKIKQGDAVLCSECDTWTITPGRHVPKWCGQCGAGTKQLIPGPEYEQGFPYQEQVSND